jgi:hypothetical protein
MRNREAKGMADKILFVSGAIFFMLLQTISYSQYRMNFGLTRMQPDSTIPKGIGALHSPVKKEKVNVQGKLLAEGHCVYRINTGWEITDGMAHLIGHQSVFDENYNTNGWYNAVVPGTVLTSLVAAGVYPDPYFGLNNLAIPDSLCRKDWWYRTTFESPASERGKMAWLCFEGINYKAKIWLNGKLLGEIHGAFNRGKFAVKDVLKESGKNVLLVQVLPPNNPGIPHEQSARSGMGPNGGQLAMDGPTFISSEGWDWVPGIRDRNMGIWQDVKLCFTGNVTAADPQIISDLPLPDTSSASINLKTALVNHADKREMAIIDFAFDNIKITKKVSLEPKQTLQIELTPEEFPTLLVKQPKLWWPNGYGMPNLYNATITVTDGAGITEAQNIRFGIREYSYEMMADAPAKPAMRFAYSPTDIKATQPIFDFANRREFGKKIFIPTLRNNVEIKDLQPLRESNNPYLVIQVNGKPVFCKGGNWGMDDAMKQVSRERLEPAFRLHREANFNLIRNWTGESTEATFFELADEYGMMVWNDFWISTEGYNLNPNDQHLFLHNTLDVIRRFRNHASIAVWCPRNEGYAPKGIEDELATQLVLQDGTRHYHGNSREANLRQSGDWHFIVDNKDYFNNYAEGFTTEIGTFSVPEASTIRKFMQVEDQWPINDVWHYHDLHAEKQNLEGYLRTVDSLYGPSKNLDDFNRKVQLVNYDSHRAIFEAWNSKQWTNGSGVLLWMTHPAWPSMIWQTYSWDFQTHGSFYGSKKGCEPLHIQMNLNDEKVIVANTSLISYPNVLAEIEIFDLNGKAVFSKTRKLNVEENNKTDIFEKPLVGITLPQVFLVRLQLKDKDNKVLASNHYWKTNATTKDFTSFNNLPNANIQCKVVKSEPGKIELLLENKSAVPAIGVRLNAVDEKDSILLPAYFSDGYFTLLPGEKKTITLQHGAGISPVKVQVEGYNHSSTLTALRPDNKSSSGKLAGTR